MNRILSILILFAVLFPASAVDRITATITVTNTPTTNGMTIVVNGDTRLFTNAFSATTILTNGNTGLTGTVATNVYKQLLTNQPSGPVYVTLPTSNTISIQGYAGQAMVVTANGGWASVAYATNVITNAQVVRVPLSVESLTNQTNIASQLARDLSAYSTSAFSGTLLGNVVQLTAAQSVSNKVLYANLTVGSTNTNTIIFNSYITNFDTNASTKFAGTNMFGLAIITNGITINSTNGNQRITNAVIIDGRTTNTGPTLFSGTNMIGTAVITNLTNLSQYTGGLTATNQTNVLTPSLGTNLMTAASDLYLDFSSNKYTAVVLTGTTAFNTTNRTGAAKEMVVRVFGGGADRALTFNAGWSNVSTYLRTNYPSGVTLTNGTMGIITLWMFGTAETDVVFKYEVTR